MKEKIRPISISFAENLVRCSWLSLGCLLKLLPSLAMAIGECSGSMLDSHGLVCDKSDLVLDLSSIDRLLASNSRVIKGKSVVAVTLNSRVSDSSLPGDSVSLPGESAPLLAPSLAGLHSPAPVPNATSSWADMVKAGNSSSRQILDFIPSVLEAGTSVLQIPPNIVAAGRKKFSLCLVGQFLGPAPKHGFIHAIANKLWGRDGVVSVASYRDGLFLFQFPTETSLSRALSGGPWHVNGIPLILRLWDPKLQKLDVSSSVLPVWVKLSDVPLELSTREGLSYLASAIGKPLHMDQDCSKLLKSDCINVCIEVDFAKPLLPKLLANIDGELRSINVSYSWKPPHCVLCNQWGHHQLACLNKKRPAVQWVPKATTVDKMPMNSKPVQQPSSTTAPVDCIAPIVPVQNAFE
ncbi:hypothetical protein Tsubulata_027947 [Turnera subulata]|uniref:DUF4283 domain-containing protein n=1 Tax=Turnera subulata TaxID=218843 RepID=A0A9Q0G8T6_9ROSI|nr:hypothetical protein Tsubulata_027947 [Turnera subulata]